MSILLFIISSFIWGSTWFPIKLQMGIVTPIWSLAYRFGAAGIILLGFCLIKKLPLSFTRKEHFRIILQSLLLCFINYILVYLALNFLVSGIAATITATMIIVNIINQRLFFKKPISRQSMLGGVIGIIGVTCMLWTEFDNFKGESWFFVIKGLFLAFGAVLSGSLGQIVLVKNLKRGLPIIQINTLSFVYGSIFLAISALILNQMPSFDLSRTYILSLGYLSLIGTVCGFLAYFTLANRIGLDKSAYVFIVTPVLAVLISSFVEELVWTPSIILGVLFVLVGNILVMRQKSNSKSTQEMPQSLKI